MGSINRPAGGTRRLGAARSGSNYIAKRQNFRGGMVGCRPSNVTPFGCRGGCEARYPASTRTAEWGVYVVNLLMPTRQPAGCAGGDGSRFAVVSLAGQAGVEDRAWFRDLLELQAARSPERIVIDLSGLSSMDWWAALMLLWVARVLTRRGGFPVLACPRPPVARVLSSAGARQVIPVFDSIQQATRPAGDRQEPR